MARAPPAARIDLHRSNPDDPPPEHVGVRSRCAARDLLELAAAFPITSWYGRNQGNWDGASGRSAGSEYTDPALRRLRSLPHHRRMCRRVPPASSNGWPVGRIHRRRRTGDWLPASDGFYSRSPGSGRAHQAGTGVLARGVDATPHILARAASSLHVHRCRPGAENIAEAPNGPVESPALVGGSKRWRRSKFTPPTSIQPISSGGASVFWSASLAFSSRSSQSLHTAHTQPP